MQRKITEYLINWLGSTTRKPLIINGARQIGKSWVVKNLGKTQFKGNFCEINFEKTPQINTIFEIDFNITRILSELEAVLNITINNDTLLFFDEIQSCPKAIMALRYFYEDMPNIAVIAAGSLLEFELKNIPFPVGRVQQINMHPMNFEEFLMAQGFNALVNKITEPAKPLPEVIEQKIYEALQNYFWVGGMPECVQHFVNTKNYMQVRKIQDDLIYAYIQDFGKYNPLVNKNCLLDILSNAANNIGSQVLYSKLSEQFTGPTIKKGVEVLSMAKIFKVINNVSVASLPFTNSGKQFKLFFLDIGLLLCINKVQPPNFFAATNLNAIFVGAWAEQFVAQQLVCNNSKINYWARTNKNSNAEVDFIIENKGEIIPIEVKHGAAGKLKSLHLLLQENTHILNAIIYSKAKFGSLNNLHFLPIYYAGKNINLSK